MKNEVYERWLRHYKAAHAIKSPVKYINGSKKREPLPDGVFENFIDRISRVLKKSSNYLDKNGYPMPAPLWHYDNDDPTTWPSAPQFKYGHLLKEE